MATFVFSNENRDGPTKPSERQAGDVGPCQHQREPQAPTCGGTENGAAYAQEPHAQQRRPSRTMGGCGAALAERQGRGRLPAPLGPGLLARRGTWACGSHEHDGCAHEKACHERRPPQAPCPRVCDRTASWRPSPPSLGAQAPADLPRTFTSSCSFHLFSFS